MLAFHCQRGGVETLAPRDIVWVLISLRNLTTLFFTLLYSHLFSPLNSFILFTTEIFQSHFSVLSHIDIISCVRVFTVCVEFLSIPYKIPYLFFANKLDFYATPLAFSPYLPLDGFVLCLNRKRIKARFSSFSLLLFALSVNITPMRFGRRQLKELIFNPLLFEHC